MNLEKTLVLNGDEHIVYRELDEGFIGTVCDYSELHRHLQEIAQLFDVFSFNIERLFESYEVRSDDHVVRKKGFRSDASDFIAVNSFVTNIISSGRSLSDSVDICIRNTYGKTSREYTDFSNAYKNHIYENNFSYRFFYDLRNFSQHNHLPVSIEDDFCFFDINKIINTPHFSMKDKIKDELLQLRDEAVKKYHDIFRVSFGFCMVEYIVGVSEMYKGFWPSIKTRLFELEKSVRDKIAADPEILDHNNKNFDGWILYRAQDGALLYALAPYADTDDFFKQSSMRADRFYNEYLKRLCKLKERFEKM